jgi:hypothetical protein
LRLARHPSDQAIADFVAVQHLGHLLKIGAEGGRLAIARFRARHGRAKPARFTAVGTTSDRSSAGILNLAERAQPLHNPDITSFRTSASWAQTLLEGNSLASK